jgi:hypothetical protein
MCTLTCLPGAVLGPSEGLRLRLVFSRDEQRTRPRALPPELTTCGDREVLMPRDGGAGGTWIAANDAGVVFALLNVNPRSLCAKEQRRLPPSHPLTRDEQPAPESYRTRGAIIAQLTDATSAEGAASRARALRLQAYRPFRVLAFDAAGHVGEVVWTGERVRHRLESFSVPLLRTSSGLGDALVAGPRRGLFVRAMRAAAGRPAAAQDAFHRHQWPGRGALSVLMSRADARTVSITTVEVGEDGLRMEYLRVRS